MLSMQLINHVHLALEAVLQRAQNQLDVIIVLEEEK